MRKHLTTAAALGAFLWLTACGSVGDPKFPARYVPNPVTDLTLVQQGASLIAVFTIPALTTDGLPVKEISLVDLRIGTGTFDPAQWEAQARLVPVIAPERPSVVRVPIPVEGLVGKEVLVGVRIGGVKGRVSAWSNLAALRVEPPLDAPAAVSVRASADGVALSWNGGNASAWRIFRMAEKDKDPTLLGESDKPEYLDRTAAFGQTYRYVVQADREKVQSEASAPVTIELVDTFPPAVPVGLAVAAGTSTIELTWLRNTEPDFKEYRVYRAVGDGAFEMIAGGLAAPAYSDAKIESGKRYRYAVAAVDQAGNVSERCAPMEASAP